MNINQKKDKKCVKKVLLRGNNTTAIEIIISVAVEKTPVVLHFRLRNLFLQGLLVDCHPVTVVIIVMGFLDGENLRIHALFFLYSDWT